MTEMTPGLNRHLSDNCLQTCNIISKDICCNCCCIGLHLSSMLSITVLYCLIDFLMLQGAMRSPCKTNESLRSLLFFPFSFFNSLFALCLSFTHAPHYLSLSLKLTPLWSLQADCFLIGGVPEVVVVMVTCKGHLEELGGGGSGWARVGGGTHSRKRRAALMQGLGDHLENGLCECVCV